MGEEFEIIVDSRLGTATLRQKLDGKTVPLASELLPKCLDNIGEWDTYMVNERCGLIYRAGSLRTKTTDGKPALWLVYFKALVAPDDYEPTPEELEKVNEALDRIVAGGLKAAEGEGCDVYAAKVPAPEYMVEEFRMG